MRPDRWASAIVELKGGVVILMGADSKEYVAWKEVKRVGFERQAVRSVRGC